MNEQVKTAESNDCGNGVCAVVVSYRGGGEIRPTVSAVASQVEQIVIVDNGSDPETRVVLERLRSEGRGRIRLILNDRNEGLSAALNQGLALSLEQGFEWTLLLDQDSVAHGGMVREMLRSYASLPLQERVATAAVCAVATDPALGDRIPAVVTTRFLNRKITAPDADVFVHFHITSGTLLKNSAVSATGMMNEFLFIDYVDFDYCFRLVRAGYRILLSARATFAHSLGIRRQGVFGAFREHGPLRIYYQTRNRLIVLGEHGRYFRSFCYTESIRFAGKLLKILVAESEKMQKMRMVSCGIRDFLAYRRAGGR